MAILEATKQNSVNDRITGFEQTIAKAEKGFEVVCVSPDSASSHLKFITKYNLAFNLIADTEKKILETYGVWAEKKLYGRTYMGVVRTTFVIDENGIIEKVITKVNTKDHAKQILEQLKIK